MLMKQPFRQEKKYGVLPSQYRREHKGAPRLAVSRKVDFTEYTILETHQFLNYFASFLHEEQEVSAVPAGLPEITTCGTADTCTEGTPLRHTWQTLKAVSPGLRIAAPSTYYDPIDNGTWLRSFTEWCIRHDCLPDDVLFHYYGTNLAPSQWGKEKNLDFPLSRLQLTKDEHLLSKCISLIRGYADEAYGPDSHVYLTEGISPRRIVRCWGIPASAPATW